MDTLRFTHRGPLRRFGGAWYSLRWTALESGGETGQPSTGLRGRRTARRVARRDGAPIARPPQNMLVADRAGTIAIRTYGSVPHPARRRPRRPVARRPDPRDRLDRELDRRGISAEHFSGQGFLASANQEPQDPRGTAEAISAPTGFHPWRALRINALLRATRRSRPIPCAGGRRTRAAREPTYYVPYFVRAAAARPADTALAHAARLLAAWDRHYTPGEARGRSCSRRR